MSGLHGAAAAAGPLLPLRGHRLLLSIGGALVRLGGRLIDVDLVAHGAPADSVMPVPIALPPLFHVGIVVKDLDRAVTDYEKRSGRDLPRLN